MFSIRLTSSFINHSKKSYTHPPVQVGYQSESSSPYFGVQFIITLYLSHHIIFPLSQTSYCMDRNLQSNQWMINPHQNLFSNLELFKIERSDILHRRITDKVSRFVFVTNFILCSYKKRVQIETLGGSEYPGIYWCLRCL